MKSGDGGRSAQRRPPARFAGCGAGFKACRPDLLDSNLVDQQALVQVEIEICERRFAAAHLGYGDIVVPGMFLSARMLVLRRVRMVHVRFVAVAVEQLDVEMGTTRAADVAVGVHVHVQAAELHGQQAHACNDGHRVSETTHGENCITAFGQRQGHSQEAAARLRPLPCPRMASSYAAPVRRAMRGTPKKGPCGPFSGQFPNLDQKLKLTVAPIWRRPVLPTGRARRPLSSCTKT